MNVENAVDHVWHALGGGPRPTRIAWSGPRGTLASPLAVDTLARACVAACALAAAGLRGVDTEPVRVDSGAVATAFVSERVLRRDGSGFSGFAPLSRFWRARDGWV
ncbi:MAG TPA: hypothetical protein VHA75_14670, partial [Rugosimonospora sp.]|nr:hypothetical protein [Rugosimonospora sp.]